MILSFVVLFLIFRIIPFFLILLALLVHFQFVIFYLLFRLRCLFLSALDFSYLETIFVKFMSNIKSNVYLRFSLSFLRQWTTKALAMTTPPTKYISSWHWRTIFGRFHWSEMLSSMSLCRLYNNMWCSESIVRPLKWKSEVNRVNTFNLLLYDNSNACRARAQ